MNNENTGKILEIKNLFLKYHTPMGETLAIKDLNLDIYKEEFITIVGPSGCGKSTLLSLISGLLKPSSGKIKMNTGEASCIDSVGYMLQNDFLFPWRTIKQNIFLGLEIKKIADIKHTNYALGLLEKYGLKKFENYYPRQLSGGMRQKAALIRTLAVNPEILLLDEPFSALDYQTRINISEEIRNIIKSEKKTSVLISHDISEAICLSDRIVILSSRPSTVKKIVDIKFEEKKYSFREKLKSKKYGYYFDIVWGELSEQKTESIF